MTTFPNSKKATLEKIEALLTPWGANATSIGLTAAQMTLLSSRTTNARAKLNNQTAKKLEALAATNEWNVAFEQVEEVAKDYVKTIRAFAETTNNQNVYSLAQIPAPKTPAPLGPPESPTLLSALLTTAGTIELAWQGSLEGGTHFIIERFATPLPGSGAPAGSWMTVGVASEKKFTDALVPQGVASISYRITAQRSGGTSTPSEPALVNFGTAPIAAAPNELKIAA